MKRTLLGAVTAVAAWGGVALAQDVENPGAGEADACMERGTCPPAPPNEDVGGSGEAGMLPPPQTNVNVNVETPPGPAPAQAVAPDARGEKGTREGGGPQMRGLTLTVGGGVEGYTGSLDSQISPGPAWSVNANIRPTRVLGLELGYNGAANNARRGDLSSGADIVRNGGQAVATLGLAAAAVQPYVLGGVGLSRYNVRGGDNTRFRDDTTGHVPLGAGLRTHVGPFTADARFAYNVLFDEDFIVTGTEARDFAGINTVNGGRYLGTLNLGGTF